MIEFKIGLADVIIIPMFFWMLRLDRRVTRIEEKIHYIFKKNGGKD